ncbi:MAG: hypothetical protein M1461_01330 [Nitrospirae bacterium]|nr:hypothetical protein [Nitrospirota bacterium]
MKVVAYLDLLGFRNYTLNDTVGALRLLEDYHAIFYTKMSDGELHPASSYKPDLQKFAESHLIDSFEAFLPFSDSIFIVSSDPDKFILQLSSFLIHCFLINSDQYMNPGKKDQPTKVTVKQMGLNETGKVDVREVEENWYPVLFRGGITYDDVIPFEIKGLFKSEKVIIPNLMGRGVVEAVGLEESIKGPRVGLSEALYNQLSTESKYYTKALSEGRYELLWPAFHFNSDDNCSDNELFKIGTLLRPALILKNSVKDPDVAIHYKCFVDLIIASCDVNFEKVGCLDKAKDKVSKIIADEGLIPE